jgi:replication initiation protein RepC
MESALSEALNAIRDLLEPVQSQDMSTNEVTNEQHYQNSNKDSYDFEPRLEKAQGEGSVSDPATALVAEGRTDEPIPVDNNLPRIPLGLVLAACSEYRTYAERPVRHWHDLVRVADVIRPMMGVSPSAWDEAKKYMGPEEASVVILAMLERFGDIRSPGGYLRSLSAKAALGEFSCGPMIMALMKKDAA